MDKQKQIEESKSCYSCNHYYACEDCYKAFTRSKDYFKKHIAHNREIAMHCKCYQPKIPENAVVLTGTETEERLEDLLIEFDEMSFYPATLMPNAEECAREWKGKLIYAIGQLRKETADKFAERMKEQYPPRTDKRCTLDDCYMLDKIDEICKEITESK